MAIIAMIVAVENRFIFRGFHEFCLSDCPASDCADPTFVGPGFRVSSDFQRQSLARRSDGESVGDPVEGKTVRFNVSRWGGSVISWSRSTTQQIGDIHAGDH
jgi:hypothetical protein